MTNARVTSLQTIDPVSEYMFAKDSDDYPFTDFTQLQFRGHMDTQAMQEAWEEALKLIPMFSSHLAVKRQGLLSIPVWEYDSVGKNSLQVEDCRQQTTEPFDPMAFSTQFHRSRITRRLDLYQEFPFRGYLLRIFDNRYILSMIYQHSVVDPSKLLRFMTRMLAVYHEKVKGDPPSWTEAVGMSLIAQRKAPLWTAPLSTVWTFPGEMSQASSTWSGCKRPWRAQVASIASSEIKDYREIKGKHGLRFVFDDFGLIQALLDRARKNGGTLNDLLLANAVKVVNRWNQEQNADCEYLRTVLVVSLKGRTQVSEEVGSGLSSLSFLLRGDNGRDLDGLIRQFRDYRTFQLENYFDIKSHAWFSRWLSLFRVIPLQIRLRYLAPLLTAHPISFALSNVGILWPQMENGRPTADSAVLGTGDLIIEDMHSCPSWGPNTSLGLVTRMHNRRLYFNFVCDRFRFRKQEAQELVNRYQVAGEISLTVSTTPRQALTTNGDRNHNE